MISISITKELFPGSKIGSIGASVIFHIPYLRSVLFLVPVWAGRGLGA